MPADGFSFAVRVRCEVNLVRFLHFFPKFCENIAFSANCDILWFISVLDIDAELRFGKVANMSLTRIHHIIGT